MNSAAEPEYATDSFSPASSENASNTARTEARSWEEAVETLDAATGPASQFQLRLAEVAGLELPDTTPTVVAAALLTEALRDPLQLRVRRNYVTEGTWDYLDNLAKEVDLSITPATQLEAEAWITHIYLGRRAQVLRELQLNSGDIVYVQDGPNAGRIARVSSVGTNGAVYLAGRGQAWPDHVEIRARKEDTSPTALHNKRLARNDAASRASTQVSHNSTAHLDRYRTEGQLTPADLAGLASVIDLAVDERPIQKYLADKPYLLTSLLTHDPRYAIPQAQLGKDYVADFLMADVDSLGIWWILVELESPRSAISLKSGNQFADRPRKGISQVQEWREWLRDNIAQARSAPGPGGNGLGFTGISGNTDGLVLVGRRASVTDKDSKLRRQEWEDRRIAVHTYDWLLEALSSIADHVGLQSINPYVLQRADSTQNI